MRASRRGHSAAEFDLGTPMEEALTRPVHRSPPKLVEAFGKRLPNFEWVKDPACSVNWSTLDSRLKLGWPPEEAISTPVGALPPSRQKPKRPERPKRDPVTYECFGEHKTLSDWVRDPRSAVASRQAVLYRLKAGVPFLDALTLAQIPGGPRPRSTFFTPPSVRRRPWINGRPTADALLLETCCYCG